MMANRKTNVAGEKRFVCTFKDCDRAFTRQEHLQRHSQNHVGGDFTCERCRAHFKRRDLLDRHVTRHLQKDAEGGSLMTRKRSWKDANGNIVAKRPALATRKDSCSGSESLKSSNMHLEPRSPEMSLEESNPTQPLSAQMPVPQAISNTENDPWMFVPDNMDPSGNAHEAMMSGESFWETPNTNGRNARADQTPALYEEVFNPDTASSFNMPFTTLSNYNWLFDIDITSLEDPSSNDLGLMGIEQPSQDPASSMQYLSGENGYNGMFEVPRDHFLLDPNTDNHALIQPNVDEVAAQSRLESPQSIRFTEPTSSQENGSSARVSSSESITSSSGRRSSSGRTSTQATSYTDENREPSKTSTTRVSSPCCSEIERPLALLDANTNLPKLDALARTQVLKLIETIRPVTPDGYYVSTDSPLLSLSALQTYSDLYFSRFNTAYPLIHTATFDTCKVETLLLVSILLLGATYCEKDAHQLAVCIHDVLRPQIFSHRDFNARPQLWVLQTTLLVECFGKSRAGQKQHDMSHLFHGLLINLIRRSDCQTVVPETMQRGERDLEDDWRAWIEGEQKKRLALLCFMWDTQHAVLFCQSLCMSAFELRSTLPCDQSLWEAESAEQWQKLRQKQKQPPLFLTVLKSYLTLRAPAAARNLNSLSRVLLLHGLMSIAWDMNRRDQTSLGIVGKNLIGDWRLRIARAYDTWKTDFDAYTMSMTQVLASSSLEGSGDRRREARTEFWIYTTVNAALYHAAHVMLFSDFLDVQIYAGARHILGRPVGKQDYSRSQGVVKHWVNQQRETSCKAVWHAAHIIKDAVMNLEDLDSGVLFIHPWCLYLATIIVWSFHHAQMSPIGGAGQESGEDDDEMVWNASADMNALISRMTSGTPEQLMDSAAYNKKQKTTGLTAIVAQHLGKIRWAVVHDGMLVLRGLVPWRLISEVEAI